MSIAAAYDFLTKAQNDQTLQAKLEAIPEGSRQQQVDGLIKIASAIGFSFTTQDYDAALKQKVAEKHGDRELSDEELDQVAGGATRGFPIWDALWTYPTGTGNP